MKTYQTKNEIILQNNELTERLKTAKQIIVVLGILVIFLCLLAVFLFLKM